MIRKNNNLLLKKLPKNKNIATIFLNKQLNQKKFLRIPEDKAWLSMLMLDNLGFKTASVTPDATTPRDTWCRRYATERICSETETGFETAANPRRSLSGETPRSASHIPDALKTADAYAHVRQPTRGIPAPAPRPLGTLALNMPRRR